MQKQKEKLQEYQVQRAMELSQQALKEEEDMRKRAEREQRRRMQEQYERKKALAQWQVEKRKAEEMLLMAENPVNPMKETFEDEEYSVENEPVKQGFHKQQNESKSGGGFNLAEDEGSGDGYSGFDEGTSSAPKSKKDPKNLTSGAFKPKQSKD